MPKEALLAQASMTCCACAWTTQPLPERAHSTTWCACLDGQTLTQSVCAGQHDVLRVRLDGLAVREGEAPRTMLLPFARAFAPVVDRGARRMEIIPPQGLLEAATEERLSPKEKRGQRRPRRRPSRHPGGGTDAG